MVDKSGGNSRDPALLRVVAEMYYERKLSQREISELIGSSIPTVSRMLAEAERRNIVQIRVIKESPDTTDLEQLLATKLGGTFIVTSGQHSNPRTESRLTGVGAARHVVELLPPKGLVGWASGHTTAALVESLGHSPLPRLDSVALVGGWDDHQSHLDSNALVRSFAEKTGGKAYTLSSPAWLPTAEAREAILSHPMIQSTLSLWPEVDIAITGSGMPPDTASNYFTVADRWDNEIRDEMIRRGVVGDIFGAIFTIDGDFILSDLTDHFVLPSLEQIQAFPTTVAVLGGHAKVKSLIGLSRTKLADVIITDQHCAEGVLDFLAD